MLGCVSGLFLFLSTSSEGHTTPIVKVDELSVPGLTELILYLQEDGDEIQDCLSSNFYAKEIDQSS